MEVVAVAVIAGVVVVRSVAVVGRVVGIIIRIIIWIIIIAVVWIGRVVRRGDI